MLQVLCNHCRKPIDPQSDNFFDLPSLTIQTGLQRMNVGHLHACSLSCLQQWLSKNSNPPSIITAQGLNPNPGPAS